MGFLRKGKIADIYHAWRGESNKKYQDIPGFCKSATIDQIRKQQWILTPGRFVGTEEEEDDEEAFSGKMKRLTSELSEQMKQGQKLDDEIKKNLQSIGFSV